MKFYEKHTWARNALSAVATKDNDRMGRDFVVNILPAIVYVAIWVIVIWVMTMSAPWNFIVLVIATVLTILWYVFHSYASEVFDPDDFEHPTPY